MDNVVQTLNAFIAADKYELYEWSPGDCSGDEDKKQVNGLLNACAEELQACFNKGAATTEAVEILNRYSEEIPARVTDTEDCEFAQEVLVKLAAIAGVQELYAAQDAAVAFLAAFKGVPVQETIARQCMDCGAAFTIDVVSRLEIAPPFWVLTRCDSCDAIDYIELPPGLLQWSLNGCRWIEMMEQTLFDREDVIAQLNKLQQQGVLLKGRTGFKYLK